ncbi:MAG: hypothetical protein VCE75_22990, partial [Alphaproteobacteria bacterium]
QGRSRDVRHGRFDDALTRERQIDHCASLYVRVAVRQRIDDCLGILINQHLPHCPMITPHCMNTTIVFQGQKKGGDSTMVKNLWLARS